MKANRLMENANYYVINLKRRPDRYHSFKSKYPLDQSSLNRVDAVDGRDLKTTPSHFKSLMPGEIGCFLSHKLLWEKAVHENNKKYSVIFEDDAHFTDNFLDKYNEITNSFKHFDILYIGGRFKKNFRMTNCLKVTDTVVKYDYNKNWNSNDCDRTTHAYILSQNFSQLLLDEYNKNESKSLELPPVDFFIINVLRYYKIDIYSAHPLLCHSERNSESDIR